MKLQPSVIVKKLFLKGQMVTLNQEIDYDQAEEIAMEFDVLCEKEEKADVEAKLGAVAWLPEQGDWHGGVTGVLPRRALKDSGLALSASWPILD